MLQKLASRRKGFHSRRTPRLHRVPLAPTDLRCQRLEKNWDYLRTLFAYSLYFLRLPQIHMLVNVKYAIPGDVKPVMYSSKHEVLVLAVDREDNGDARGLREERKDDNVLPCQ
ncbi:hypothetical protein C8F01DRAFT_1354005 [Mycena amicta]|nr:hypothetical protein C8F01DRAFT_1354005 [Mycena amicta]